MNKAILFVTLSTTVACSSSKKVQCDSYSQELRKKTDTTIFWQDDQVKYIEILESNKVILPNIPTNKSTSLHINGLTNGIYTIVFYSGSDLLFTQKLEIN
jgi:hypothetical protein